MLLKSVHCANAEPLIVINVSGNVTDLRLELFANAKEPISVTPVIVTVVKFEFD
jgi:hypothetical protein